MGEVAGAWECPVDLLVKAQRSGTLFRVADCYRNGGEWFAWGFRFPLKTEGWEPVAWMPRPPIPSEEEVRAWLAAA